MVWSILSGVEKSTEAVVSRGEVMKHYLARRAAAAALVLSIVLLPAVTDTRAQRGRGGQAGPPPMGQAGAPIDMTGTWVSVVTEDWLWRMITPPVGDYASLPINPEGRAVADAWDRERDIASGEECKAWGAAGLMRMPTRVRISWEDENTLKLETDSGMQTRLFHFNDSGEPEGPSIQGFSAASWEGGEPGGGGAGFGAFGEGTAGGLNVVTTNLAPGYLRKNGVPYSGNGLLTEYFDRHSDFGDEWFTVTTIVEDPEYLTGPFITSSHFKREADDSGFNPMPCLTDPPLVDEPVEN